MHYTIKDLLDTDNVLPDGVLAYGYNEDRAIKGSDIMESDSGRITYHEHQREVVMVVTGFGIESKGWEITGQLPAQDFDADSFLDAVKASVGAAVFNKHVEA